MGERWVFERTLRHLRYRIDFVSLSRVKQRVRHVVELERSQGRTAGKLALCQILMSIKGFEFKSQS